MTLFVNQALRKAGKLTRKGEFDLAIQLYMNILAEYPNNKRAADGLLALQHLSATGEIQPTREQIDELISLYNQGRLQETLERGEALARQFPAVPSIPSLVGAVNVSLGFPERAIPWYTKALTIKPDFAEAHSNLGAALNELGKHDEAIESIDMALRIKPDFAVAHNNLGNALKGLGKPQQAIACFREAVQIAPDYAEAHNNLGTTLADLGASEEAKGCLSKALQIKPDFAEAHNNLGHALIDLGQPEDAVNCFRNALTIKPGIAEVHNNLGNALIDLGQPEEAAACFHRALEIRPDFAGAHRNLSAVTNYKRDDPQTRKMLQLVSREGLPEEDRMHLDFALAKAQGDADNPDEAFACLSHGNRLLRKKREYDIETDRALFAEIRSAFEGDLPAAEIVDSSDTAKRPQPVFIVGMPRSGTTLVEQILASHTRVFGAGELRLLDQSIRAAEWRSGRPSLSQLTSIRTSYFSGLANIGATEPSITDKMPLNFRWLGFLFRALPEATVIHVVRDARATCWSNFKQYFSRKGQDFANDLEDVAEYYKLYVSLMAFWHGKFPGRIYDLDYKALTEHQEDETRQLLAQIGLSWEDQCLEFHKTERMVQTASATQVRQRMYQGSSEEWRKYERHLQPMIELLRGF